ncbi:MAG: class E sortase [Acidimicrobiales bacterium]|nr:class E sortase [Acidimicrobiales bacterium]
MDDLVATDGDRSGARRRALRDLRPQLAAAALAALALVAVGSARGGGVVDTTGARAGAAAAMVPAPSPPSTVVTTTSSTAAPSLPLPEPLPADPYAPTPEIVLGRIAIPALGVDEPLQEGITLTAINRGPGHWPGTPLPGEFGNMVVAGHRTTYSKPFNRLDELVAGDQVVFTDTTGMQRWVYEVRGVIVVPAENVGVASQSAAHTATLFACHPKGSASQRIVAKLRLLDERGRPVDDEAALPPLDVGLRPTDDTLVVRGYPEGEAPANGLGDPFGQTAS